MQVDPLNPKLKVHVSKSLKLKCDKLLCSFGFKFDLRQYMKEPYTTIGWVHSLMAYNTAGRAPRTVHIHSARDCSHSLILYVCAPVVIIGCTDCLVHTGPLGGRGRVRMGRRRRVCAGEP